jgi:hypothetical protein
MAALEAAIAIDPDFDHAHWNVALTRLLLGDFEGGWVLRERGPGLCAGAGSRSLGAERA